MKNYTRENTMRTTLVSALATATLISTSAVAKTTNIRWDLVDVNYQVNDYLNNLSGLQISASKHIQPDFFVTGRYSATSDSGATRSVDLDQVSLGLGYVVSSDAKEDWFVAVSLDRVDVTLSDRFGRGGFDENSLGLALGWREMLSPQLEWSGYLKYNTFSTFRSFGGGLSINYYLSKDIAANLAFEEFAGISSFLIGGRYVF